MNGERRRASSRPTVLTAFAALVAALVTAFMGACQGDPSEGGEPGPTFDPEAVIATKTVQTLDGTLTIDLPIDLVVQPQRQGILATSADGGYRFYLSYRPGGELPAELGALKDELIGLGWEVESEQHFESAVVVSLARGPKSGRTSRELWLVAGAGRVAICEAIAREAYRARLGDPLRKTCQGMRLTGPAAAPPAGAPPPGAAGH